jgi:hypothetical protein
MIRSIASRLAPALFVASLAVLLPAHAAEPVFPTGSRVGLVPPPGLEASRSFIGFADVANKVALLVAVLPARAYADIEKSMTPEMLKKQGVIQESRAPFPLALGKAFLVIGRQEIGTAKLHKWLLVASTPKLTALVTVQVPDAARKIYPDAAIRAALASLAVRPHVPDAEQLSLLPFKLTNLADFKIDSVVPGRLLLLSDAAADKAKSSNRPRIVIAALPATAAQMDDHDAFARRLFAHLSGVEQVHITEAGALRIAGQQGHQILASGKDAKSGADLIIVQWLRFGAGGFLQLLGISPTKDWKQTYPRFRAVRDAIALR